MDFSEGTKVRLAPGGRAEVLAIDAEGARLRVHEGSAHLAVTHKPGARWSVVAGPFTVQVVGTEFDVAWTSAVETLEVALYTGSVYVEGPPSLSLPLQAGRRLVVRGPSRALEISAIETPAAPALAPAPVAPVPAARTQLLPPAIASAQPKVQTSTSNRAQQQRVAVLAPAAQPPARTVSPPPAESPPAPSPQPRPTVTPVSWSVRMAAGEYQIVVDEALSAGLEQSLRARPSGDLSALSDAARYVGRADVARRALVAQRQRFPETDSAASAAFHLGTLAEQRDPTSREALKWYDLYLSTAPAGTFVPETLGRKMLILQRRDDMTAARSIAEAYRRQFPGGPYRRQADRILARP
jgi:TolA-binding protein